MSQQYPNLPSFGTNYQATPPYSPYAANVPQTSSTIPVQQQQSTPQSHNYQAPPAQANDIRFNANMQLPAQAPPFPFPSAINPDMFSHFPPPPPPPPMLPLNFNSTPSTPMNFPHFSSDAAGMQSGFDQSTYAGIEDSSIGTNSGSAAHPFVTPSTYSVGTHQSRPTELGNPRPHQAEHESESYLPHETSRQHSRMDKTVEPHNVDDDESEMYDPANAFRVSAESMHYYRDRSSGVKTDTTPSQKTTQRDGILAHNEPPIRIHSQAELKEKAKAAILSLSSHRITFHDLLAEGLNPDLVRSLFDELHLDMDIKQQDLASSDVQTENVLGAGRRQDAIQTQISLDLKIKDTNKVEDSSLATVKSPIQSTVANSGMERKDRIAQLLAAKAAKNHPSNPQSPSASPASIADSALQQRISKSNESGVTGMMTSQQPMPTKTNKVTPSVELTGTQLEQLRNVAGDLLQNVSEHNLPASISLLPTPIRETLVEKGLSSLIPGLFMGNDEEQVEIPTQAKSTRADLPSGLKIMQSATNNASSRKRSADWMMDSEQSAPKRASMPREDRMIADVDIEVSESGEASEGEIIEDQEIDMKQDLGHRQQEQASPLDHHSRADEDGLRSTSRVSHTQPEKTSQTMGPFRGNSQTSSPRPISKLTPAQLAERAAQLKADLMRQRRLRQQELTEGMPVLNKEVVKTQQRIEQSKLKLAEIRGQLQNYEAETTRARESERDLLEEIKRLELQLEEGVNGQKRFSDELRTIKLQGSSTSHATKEDFTEPASSSNDQLADVSVENETPSLPEPSQIIVTEATKQDPSDLQSALPNSQQPSTQFGVVATPESSSGHRLSASQSGSPDNSEINGTDNVGGQMSAVQLRAELSNAINTNVATPHVNNTVDDEESGSVARSEDSRMSIDDDTDEESEGSVSMSDSGSEDYEPADHQLHDLADDHQEDSEDYEPEEDTHSKPQFDEIADDYEPSEAIEVMDTTESPNGHPQGPVQAITTVDGTETRDVDIRIVDKSLPRISEVVPQSNIDDEEADVQLSEANTLTRTHDPAQDSEHSGNTDLNLDTEVAKMPHYIPYQSPLSSFKSYRFHSSFSDQIKSGFRSLTYSNNIDPSRPICPTELSGAVCSDPNCEEQHFESMALTDDKILVQMSSANDITDRALRDEYLVGLKQVIAGLRQNNVKDFSEVASALSQYRRQWAVAHLDS